METENYFIKEIVDKEKPLPKKDKKKHAMKGKAIEGDKCLWNRRLKMKKKEKLNYKSPKN